MKIAKLLLPVSALLLLSACTGFRQPHPGKNTYSLEATIPQTADAGKVPPATLQVRHYSSAPECEIRSFASVHPDHTYTSDYYNNFIATPAQLIAHQTRLYFEKTKTATVVFTNSKIRAAYFLEAQLLAFHYEPAPVKSPKAAGKSGENHWGTTIAIVQSANEAGEVKEPANAYNYPAFEQTAAADGKGKAARQAAVEKNDDGDFAPSVVVSLHTRLLDKNNKLLFQKIYEVRQAADKTATSQATAYNAALTELLRQQAADIGAYLK